MSDLQELKDRAKLAQGRGKNKDTGDILQDEDVFMILHKNEVEAMADLIFDALEHNRVSGDARRTLVDVLRHLGEM